MPAGAFSKPWQGLLKTATGSGGGKGMAEVFVAKVADIPDGERKIVQHGCRR